MMDQVEKKIENERASKRSFLKKAGIGAAALAGAAAITQCEKRSDSKPAAPAVQPRKKIQWKMATTWPKNFPGLGTGANFLAETIGKMSDGELTVKVYGGGELVPSLEAFDAVSKGTAEMGHGAAYYWKGKMSATQFFAAVPFGLNAVEMNGWIHYGGGQKLWDEVYSNFGVKGFLAGNTGVQMGGWFNKEINSLEDFKGLKMRMPGLGGEVLNTIGAVAVSLSGGEIFQSLQSGSIDATEWVGPYNDLAFGLYKAAKYYYWPGWHEPGTALESFVNKKAYEALPSHLQTIVAIASEAANENMFSEFTARNGVSLAELVNQHGVIVKKFPDDVMKQLASVSKEVVSAVADGDPASKKVYESFNDFRKKAVEWDLLGENGYSQTRKQLF